MKFIPLSWLAKIHYPSFVEYQLEQAGVAYEKTIDAIQQCARMKVELMFSSDPKADQMLTALNTMVTVLESRATLIKTRMVEIRTRQTLIKAFDIQVGDAMPDLDNAIAHLDKVFADLAKQGVN
jgi:hypothetical protein